ncbi:MAG: ATP-grasp domain-containing protein [Anaerolineae bacterium]|nr:ATP-grasp domain-containing protein [Anaerolineae bacterium]
MSKTTILCFASYYKGDRLIQAVKEAGCHTILLTEEKHAHEPWPWQFIDEVFYMPNLYKQPDVIHAVSYLMRSRAIDQIIALDDFDVEVVAHLREHFRMPGLKDSLARHFRDKLAMRTQARATGIRVPDFIGIFNYDHIRAFMAEVAPPYVLKPRGEASAMGIKKINHPDELWPLLEQLGDRQSFHLLEKYIPGDVYHVDSLVDNGKVIFSSASKYARPPMNVYQGGGVFITRTLDRDGEEAKQLQEHNKALLKGLGLERGAAHAEFIRGYEDGEYYFLEVAARVGGANISESVEQAAGVNLWAEWGLLEVAAARGEKYKLPKLKKGYAGVINCLARQEWPDLSAYTDPEIVWRMHKKYHAGFIVASPDAQRVEDLLNQYTERFGHDFLAVMPPLEKAADAH